MASLFFSLSGGENLQTVAAELWCSAELTGEVYAELIFLSFVNRSTNNNI